MIKNYIPDIAWVNGLRVGKTKIYGLGHHKVTGELIILYRNPNNQLIVSLDPDWLPKSDTKPEGSEEV